MDILAKGARRFDLEWTLNNDGLLEISGDGYMESYSYDFKEYGAPWAEYGTFIKKAVIHPDLRSIGNCAFIECKSLEEVTLPDGLKEIGDYAFRLCESLKKIVIPEGTGSIGVSAFSACTKLESITLPAGLREIEDFTFVRCRSLKKIYIPKTVTSIGLNAFLGCSSLKEIFFEGDRPRILSEAFYDVSAAAYYPAENKTWTQCPLKNYGGDICWKEKDVS